MQTLKPSDIARFNTKYNKAGDEECWNWNNSEKCRVNKAGLPQFTFNGTTKTAAAVAAHLYLQTPLRGHTIHRSCKNKLCINPKHFTIGERKYKE